MSKESPCAARVSGNLPGLRGLRLGAGANLSEDGRGPAVARPGFARGGPIHLRTDAPTLTVAA
jgi:hypothetical protein